MHGVMAGYAELRPSLDTLPTDDPVVQVMLFASDIVFRRWLREEPTGAARRRRQALRGLSQTGQRHH